MRLDDPVITPLTKKPASNLTMRYLSQSGSARLFEVKWDTEPGGIYEFYTGTDLQNWAFNRTYTASASTFAVTRITQPSTQPRFFYRVARQQ